MMKKSIVLLLLAVAYASQNSAIAAPSDSLWDQAKASVNEYRGKVNNALSSALINGYTSLSQKADSLIESIILNGTAVISGAYNEYMSEYQSVKQAAEDAGTDVTDCINTYEELITNVGPENLDGLVQCVQDLVEPVVSYISGASNNLVQRYSSTVYQHEKSLLTCGPSNDNCLSNIVYSLIKVNVEGQIANDLTRDVSLFGSNENRLNVCGQKYVSINEGKGNSLVEAFRSCVEAQSG
ncbi:uncharacterized protein LOC135137498 [Zophobas morio]|uniref:uncharacterized protein LOC135137498 n=1 Tax=Zophobas morio TaxID=2755281 RepID=UPI0030833FF0